MLVKNFTRTLLQVQSLFNQFKINANFATIQAP